MKDARLRARRRQLPILDAGRRKRCPPDSTRIQAGCVTSQRSRRTPGERRELRFGETRQLSQTTDARASQPPGQRGIDSRKDLEFQRRKEACLVAVEDVD